MPGMYLRSLFAWLWDMARTSAGLHELQLPSLRMATIASRENSVNIEIEATLPDSEQYDASCIRVLDDREAWEKMPWLEAETLASTSGKDLDFIKRGLEACRRAGVSHGYFIRRYLEDDKTVPFSVAVDYQSRVVQGLVVEKIE